jgi:hypothetical protein
VPKKNPADAASSAKNLYREKRDSIYLSSVVELERLMQEQK